MCFFHLFKHHLKADYGFEYGDLFHAVQSISLMTVIAVKIEKLFS